MSKLFDYLKFGFDIRADETELQEIRDIVLEEAGFKWIPIIRQVSKDPEINKECLITVESPDGNLYTDKTFYSHKGLRDKTKIIAWMPLPKPYDPNP